MQSRARSNSQLQANSQSALQTPTRLGEAARQQRAYTPMRTSASASVGRSAGAAPRMYTPQNRPPSLLSTPLQTHRQPTTAAGTSALRRGRRQSEAGVGSGAAWRGEQFPGLPAAAPSTLSSSSALQTPAQQQQQQQQPLFYSSSIVRSHTVADPFQTPTAHNERRSDSRGSMYSVASGHGFLNTHSSGKQPVLVRSVRLDLKVVPPALDAAKAERKEATRGEHRQQQRQSRERAARVRVRMDVSVHVLHAGEQRVDLLSVAESHLLQRSRSDRRGQTRRGHSSDGRCWPVVERTACAVAGSPTVGDYAESVVSPVVSPTAPQPAVVADETPVPVPVRRAATGESDRLSLSIQRADNRARPQPMFHVDELSPYPPAPCTPSPPQTQTRELPEGASRYETHTLSSFARAQARVSDRIALYNELSQASLRPGLQGGFQANSRRTQSFGAQANSAIGELGLGLGLGLALDLGSNPGVRPASALESGSPARSDMPLRNELLMRAANAPERPHSAMGLMSPVQQHSRTRRRRRASSVASTATRDGMDAAPASGSCVFEVDRVRGTLVARLSECRRYRLTVWFSIAASADALPAAGIDFWESGSVAISGIPRSLNTRVRVRLPHRLPADTDDLLTSTTTGSYFYAVRMVQPPRVEPQQSTRAVDARAASSSVSHGRALPLPSLLFSPASPAFPAHFPGDAGWLLTDDSDAGSGIDEVMTGSDELLMSRSNTGDADREADVNRKLMGFIMESRRRTSISLDGPRPWLVGDADDAGGNEPEDVAEASESSRRDFWLRFASENHCFDFVRAELTVFKLKLAESVTLSWAPRFDPGSVGEFGRSVSEADRPFELSPLLSQETMPIEQHFLPELPVHDARHLETIFSAEPTPVVDAPAEPLVAFSPPTLKPQTAATSLVCLDKIDACLAMRPDGFVLSTTVCVRRQQDQADFVWPAFVDLDFSPLLVAIGAVRSVDLRHRRVSLADGSFVRWASGSSDAVNGTQLEKKEQASRLRIWLPADSSDGDAVSLIVESAPALKIEFRGMALTKSFFVAVPVDRLATLVGSYSSNAAASASVRVANEAELWVSAVQSDSKGVDLGALSLAPEDPCELFQVVSIERRVSPITALFSQKLAAAYAAAVDYKDKQSQPIFATALGIAVDVQHGIAVEETVDPADRLLVVRVAIDCSLATFSSWRSQLGHLAAAADDRSTLVAPFLAMAVPEASGQNCAWQLESLELALTDGQGPNSSKVPVQTVVDLDPGVIAIPLTPKSRPSPGSSDVLLPEVVVDCVACVFSCNVPLSMLNDDECCLWLPVPRFAQTATERSPDDAVFARSSTALLDSASITVSSASGGTFVRAIKEPHADKGVSGTGIECAVDTAPCKPLVAQKLLIALADLSELFVRLRPLPAPKQAPQLVTRATDTDDLDPVPECVAEPEAELADRGIMPADECPTKPATEEDTDELDDTAAVSCISMSPSPVSSLLASPVLSARQADDVAEVVAEEVAEAVEDGEEDLAGDLFSVHTPSIISNFSIGSGHSIASSSLRNRHASRTRVASETALASSVVGISMHADAVVPCETQPLLSSSLAESEPQSLASRAWRGFIWVLSILAFVVVTFAVLALLSGDVFDMQQPEMPPSISLPDHPAMLATESAAVLPEESSVHVSLASAGRSRVFLRGKSSDIYELLISEHLESSEDSTVEVTNDGAHSFNTVAADTSSSLLGLLYRLVIEPLLGILNTTG